MTTIFWAGDSTVKENSIVTWPQTGIGQAFRRYARQGAVQVENHAENGRSTKSFLDEGRLEPIRQAMREGDLLFIQFGHNDEKSHDPARHAAPEGDFRRNLAIFADAARSRGAQPVFITPATRFHLGEKDEEYRHVRWAAAMRAEGERLQVPVIDLTALSEELVMRMGPGAQETFYMHLPPGRYPHYPAGVKDNSHLQPAGALAFAGLIAQELHRLGGKYAALLCEDYAQHCRDTARLKGLAEHGL